MTKREREDEKKNLPLRRDPVLVDRSHTRDVESNQPHGSSVEAFVMVRCFCLLAVGW
jgi:hypothetical protein